MPARTIKGPCFAIILGGKRIVVKHIPAKGKRCRVIVPVGALIETGHNRDRNPSPSVAEVSTSPE